MVPGSRCTRRLARSAAWSPTVPEPHPRHPARPTTTGTFTLRARGRHALAPYYNRYFDAYVWLRLQRLHAGSTPMSPTTTGTLTLRTRGRHAQPPGYLRRVCYCTIILVVRPSFIPTPSILHHHFHLSLHYFSCWVRSHCFYVPESRELSQTPPRLRHWSKRAPSVIRPALNW